MPPYNSYSPVPYGAHYGSIAHFIMNREARVGLVFLIGIAAALWLTVATGDVSQGTGTMPFISPPSVVLDVGAAVRYNGCR